MTTGSHAKKDFATRLSPQTLARLDQLIQSGRFKTRTAAIEAAIELTRPIRLVTATLTIDETVFTLLQELLLRPPYSVSRSRSQYLGAHPEIVRQIMASVDYGVQRLLAIISLEPVLPTDINAMR